jgi:hypothetical protein
MVLFWTIENTDPDSMDCAEEAACISSAKKNLWILCSFAIAWACM